MKQHTSDFKSRIPIIGRQFDDYITYGTTTLREELYSISLHYDGGLLKSIMKQLDIESSVDIPIGTKISYKKGLLVNGAYEYLDYGSFYVYKSERSEDKRNYNITCYDAMLFSMVEYTGMSITFPITVRAYLTALCNKIGVPFLSSGTNFVNYNRALQVDPFVDADGNSLGFTIRDILDNLSQVTASNICIGNNGIEEGIEVRYITETNDTIDGNYLKDVNINFGEKYGPINSIVLSRAGGSDNVYLQDEESIEENGLCELKITDNEIMNFNDRSDYLPEILEKLDGLEYYVNDYSSTGICYYEPCDMYHIEIDDNTYKCIMFNDEINTTTGLEELVHTEIPEEAQTDYTKADKTDRRINQTYLMVDKQNQQIQALISRTNEHDTQISELNIEVGEISSKVKGVYDLTQTVLGNRQVTVHKCLQGYILEMHIYGNNEVFKYLYPEDDLYPSDDLYPHGDSRLIVTDADGNSMTYELGVMDVLRANDEVQDEYILKDNYAKVIRRVNPDGTTKINEVVEDLGVYTIYIANGDNTFRIKNYYADISVQCIVENSYTNQFTPQVVFNSITEQTEANILLEVSQQYVGQDEIISRINQTPEQIQIQADKISLEGKTIDMTSENINIDSDNFKVDKDGNVTCNELVVTGGSINGVAIDLAPDDIGGVQTFRLRAPEHDAITYLMGRNMVWKKTNQATEIMDIGLFSDTNKAYIDLDGDVTCNHVYADNVSDRRVKSNIKDCNANALEKIMQIKHKQFTKNVDGKHYDIGYIAQDMEEIDPNFVMISKDGTYYINELPIISTLSKAIQEQQVQIEELKEEINKLKGEK